jgi:osmotically inducible lipoprotein OsmB
MSAQNVLPTQNILTKSLLVVVLLAMTGCADLDPTQQRMLTGAAAGTAIGAGATVLTGGCVACGAVIGGAVGTGVGYVVSKTQ